VSASIDDLGDFASLFGANREDFAGRIKVDGTFDARNRNLGGSLIATGSGLTMFKESIDEFQTTVNLKREAIEIAQMELKRKKDLIRAQGKIDTSAEHNYSGSIDATVENLMEYIPASLAQARSGPISATFRADITSSVWETRVVLDTAESQPTELAATFSLSIGKPLGALLTSPLTLSVDIPALHLADIPVRESSTRPQSGVASGQFTITETLQHPRVSGHLNVMNARFGLTGMDARVWFGGNRATVEKLTLGDKPHQAWLSGDIDLQDTRHLIVRLTPNQLVYDISRPMLDCVHGFAVGPGNWASDGPVVTALELSGDIAGDNWQVKLEETQPSTPAVAPGYLSATKTLPFCSGPGSTEPTLVLGVSPEGSPTPSPSPARKRTRRG
jgi:hypothetical protein